MGGELSHTAIFRDFGECNQEGEGKDTGVS